MVTDTNTLNLNSYPSLSPASHMLTLFGARWYYVMSFTEPQCYEDNRTYRGYWQREERSI